MFFRKRKERLNMLNNQFDKAYRNYKISSKATNVRFKNFSNENKEMNNEFLKTHNKIQNKINKFT